MNTMTYKGYTATVEYSEEDGCLIGRLIGMRDIVAFDATSVNDLRKQFHKAVEHYLWVSEKLGLTPERAVAA